MKTNLVKMLGIPIFLCLVMMSCSKEGGQDSDKFLKSSNHESDLLTITFDLESYISTRVLNPNDEGGLHELDKVGATPIFKRDKGYIRVKSDSSIVAFLDLIEPSNQLTVQHQVAIDPNRKIPAYVTIEHNIAKTFDNGNQLLHEHPMDMSSFKEMVDLIATGKYRQAPTLEDGFTKVFENNERYDIYETITENGDKLTMTIDVEHDRLAFTELFNAMNEPIMKKVFQYKEGQTNGDYPIIERTLELVYQKSVEGTIDMVKTITTDFKTFIFSENI